jgi:CTP synthase
MDQNNAMPPVPRSSSIKNNMKYIVVTGGVISGVGKGIFASSTGVLLKAMGQRVTAIKIDPYLNIDAGTLSPYDHGEVYTLDDGGEVDLDLGNYERFLDVTLSRAHNITTGKVYQKVIEKERKGYYLGKTVQVVPHLTDAIQDWIEEVARAPVDGSSDLPQVCIVEVGGTVGDIESAPFVEALRQFQFRVGTENFMLAHVSLVPQIGSGEQKSKPTQSSVRDLRGLGLSPDIITCRSQRELEDEVKAKISMFCHVQPSHVLAVHDCHSTYHVPLLLAKHGLDKIIAQRLGLPDTDLMQSEYWRQWTCLTRSIDMRQGTLRIALVGKYTQLRDSYLSIARSIDHASIRLGVGLDIMWIEATDLEDGMKDHKLYEDGWQAVHSAHAIIIPGGFGGRGAQGKIEVCRFARQNKRPMLGLCLGFQLAVIEYSRNVAKMDGANSTEIDPNTKYPVIIQMPELSKTQLGGTMRLGLRTTIFEDLESKSFSLYSEAGQCDKQSHKIHERHRHRFEVNPEFVVRLEDAGLKFVGRDDTGKRMEILEISDHPFYIGTQFHPEFRSRAVRPSPLFMGLLRAAMQQKC